MDAKDAQAWVNSTPPTSTNRVVNGEGMVRLPASEIAFSSRATGNQHGTRTVVAYLIGSIAEAGAPLGEAVGAKDQQGGLFLFGQRMIVSAGWPSRRIASTARPASGRSWRRFAELLRAALGSGLACSVSRSRAGLPVCSRTVTAVRLRHLLGSSTATSRAFSPPRQLFSATRIRGIALSSRKPFPAGRNRKPLKNPMGRRCSQGAVPLRNPYFQGRTLSVGVIIRKGRQARRRLTANPIASLIGFYFGTARMST